MNETKTPASTRAVTHTINRARPETVRLWTIQPLWVWERLYEQKTLFSNPSQLEYFSDLKDDYDWMRGQMRRRLPDYLDHYPWWAYDHKTDLRHRHTDSNRQHVRLELGVPQERVLLSAYGAWHFALNKFYLPYAVEDAEYQRESDAWDEELEQHGLNPYSGRPLPEPWHTRMTASWERIFDVEDLRETNTIQACFERLDLEDVVKVTVFTPRPFIRNIPSSFSVCA